MSEAIIIAVLAAVGGGAVAALIGGIFQRPKTKAEVGKLVAEEGRTIDQRWKEWADELEQKLANERAEHAAEITGFKERLSAVEDRLVKSDGRVQELETELAEAREEIARLQRQVATERDVTRSIVGWAFALRDEIRRLGGSVPDAPARVEVFIAGYIEDAEDRRSDG